MANLLETYSLQTGLKIKRPHIKTDFFPLDVDYDKAILIHGSAGNGGNFPSKCYDLWDEFVALVAPVLIPLGYKIYQIGLKDDRGIVGAESLLGKTTIHQTAFLLKHCSLLVGNDSINSHIRGGFEKVQITLFGSTCETNHGPCWRHPDSIMLESHRMGNKPSFSSNETPKTINLIPPEQVANAVFKILGLPATNYKSWYFGAVYNQTVIELIPDCVPTIPGFTGVLTLRLDYDFVPNILNHLQYNVNIITNKEIDLGFLTPNRGKIQQLTIEADKVSPEYILKVNRIGLKVNVFSRSSGKELEDLRLKFLDVCLINQIVDPDKNAFIETAKKYTNGETPDFSKQLFYRSTKFILSKNKIYLSRAAFLLDKPVNSFQDNSQEIIDTEDFWKETHHYAIYKKER